MLELGAGYGRLLGVLAAPKRKVIGLELDREFLILARRNLRRLPAERRRSVRLLQADMRDFALPEPVERVLLPYNTLYCLLTKRDALACFRAVRRALAPGGVFAFDVWNAGPFHDTAALRASADDTEPVVTVRYAGQSWDVFERSRLRRAQRLDVEYSYLSRAGAARRVIPIAQRYYLPGEVEALLTRAGFAIQARYGDFLGRRFTARSSQLIVLARAI